MRTRIQQMNVGILKWKEWIDYERKGACLIVLISKSLGFGK